MVPRKTLATLAVFAALLWGLAYLPATSNWVKAPSLDTLVRMAGLGPAAAPETGKNKPELAKKDTPAEEQNKQETEEPEPVITPRIPESVKIPDVETGPPTSVLDPSGQMRFFYESLARTESRQPGAITRILHYGDSPVTADSITADARAILQAQYGDAGHGFILIDKPWAWYMHRGVDLAATGWSIDAASQNPRARDGFHGLGGVSFRGGPGATTRIILPDSKHNRLDLLFLRQPRGGELKVETLANPPVRLAAVSTDGPEVTSGFESIPLPEETSRLRLTVTRGTVRMFGVVLEKNGPGVEYSSLGLNGASVQHLHRYFDLTHWTQQLAHQNPDLIILNYGTNESVFPKYVDTLYSGELRQVLDRLRAAAPKASILVMSPMDRGERRQGKIETLPIMPKIVELQHQIALDSGCAFFDTFHAMGGPGTMARWYDNKPRLVNADYTHPLPGGAAIIGNLLDRALMEGFEKWKGHRQ